MKKKALNKIIGITIIFLILSSGISITHAGPTNPLEPDEEPPEIFDVLVEPQTQNINNYVNISCTVIDNIAVSSVKVNITDPDDSTQNITMTYNNKTNLAYYNTTYSLPGDYTLYIWANDTSDNQNKTNNFSFNIFNNPPNIPSNPNPENNAQNVPTDTVLSWTGGDPDGDDVLYDVLFGNTTNPSVVSENQSETQYTPDLEPGTTYYWQIWASDTHGDFSVGPLWKFTTGDSSSDLSVDIIFPEEPGFYFRGQKRIGLPNTIFVYGSITIQVNATAEAGIKSVTFVIGNINRYIDTEAPYEYELKKIISGPTTITVIARDNEDNIVNDSVKIFKWRIHPVLIAAGAFGAFKAFQRVAQGKPIIGWTIIRGTGINVKEQGNSIIFRALRLHFTEITGVKTSTGIIRGKRVRISDVGLNRMLTIGPFGSLSYIFAVSYGELEELS